MTETEFIDKLKILLKEAEEKGLPYETICQLAEHILEQGWNNGD